MAALDWVILAALLVSLLLGVVRGLVYEVMAALSWIAAFVLAEWLAPRLGAWLPMGGATSEPLRYAAGFAVVFILAVFAGGLLAWNLRRLVEAAGLRPMDRALGAAFGVVRGVVLLLAAAVMVNMTPLRGDAWWTESKGAVIGTRALKGLRPVVPERFGQYLPR
jgi:membrane protein required for colicin V production